MPRHAVTASGSEPKEERRKGGIFGVAVKEKLLKAVGVNPPPAMSLVEEQGPSLECPAEVDPALRSIGAAQPPAQEVERPPHSAVEDHGSRDQPLRRCKPKGPEPLRQIGLTNSRHPGGAIRFHEMSLR